MAPFTDVEGQRGSKIAAWPGLDATDLKLIAALQDDGRASMAKLARSTDQPVPRAKARFDRLTAEGTLQTVALIDPIALGRPVVAHLDIVTIGDNGVVADRLARVSGVAWIGIGADHARLLVQVSTASNAELVDLVNESIRGAGDIKSVATSIVLRSWSPRFAFAPDDAETSDDASASLWRSGHDHGKLIDSVDRILLTCLEVNPRASLTAMSAEAGLSVPATRQRLLKLTQERTLQFRTRPNPRSDSVQAVRFLLDTDGTSDEIVGHLVNLPHVNFVSESTGTQSISLEILAPDGTTVVEAYDRVSKAPGVLGIRMVRFQRIATRRGGW